MIKNNKINSGFTIIEISVSMVVTIIVLGSLLGLQQVISQNQTTVFNHSIEVDIANSSMKSLVKELRNSHYGDNGAYLIQYADEQSIIFYSDINLDGVTEKIRYFLDGTELKKGIIEPQGFPATYPDANEQIRVVADNVRNGTLPLFYYYNSDWPEDATNNPLAVPADQDSISLVRIHIRINTQADDTNRDYVLESFAQIRTIKSNL